MLVKKYCVWAGLASSYSGHATANQPAMCWYIGTCDACATTWLALMCCCWLQLTFHNLNLLINRPIKPLCK
jgi:hypothetical protein